MHVVYASACSDRKQGHLCKNGDQVSLGMDDHLAIACRSYR